MRGDHTGVDISDFLPKLQAENWTWFAHTHPGTRDIMLNLVFRVTGKYYKY
jgi:hypothetical protein